MVRRLFPNYSNYIQTLYYTTPAPPVARGKHLLTVNLISVSLLFFVFLKSILWVKKGKATLYQAMEAHRVVRR
jgi:hypothetical protein